jgi:ComF family protein
MRATMPMQQLRHRAHGAVKIVLDAVFPPRCPSCQVLVAAEGNFCAPCFQALRMIEKPLCVRCGTPFVVAMDADAQCPACLVEPPEYDQARAALVYDAVSAPLVTALKFNDQWAHVARYVALMQRAGSALFPGADALVPVPLHWRRLFVRKFNQSAILAYGLAQQTGLPCAPHLLERVLYTRPQMRLSRTQRLKNVTRAFAVPERFHAHVQGKYLVLIDDVVTTGATANACARALKKAGAKEVRVLALARTVHE